MDDPNITMEEYIRLEEEKARRCVRCITWKLLRMVRSGIIVHDLGSVETEFPAIVFNDTLTSEALLCEPKPKQHNYNKQQTTNKEVYQTLATVRLLNRNQGTQNVRNQKGLSVVSKIANQYGNRDVVTAPAERNGNGINVSVAGIKITTVGVKVTTA
ncbi:hypothetical protein Tco_1093835 [Tanacetum coccineum]|uniref:Uncharacterized protein n=1 Tax=Tanacetum coccineum TaxID=301880 RepID=A0ABQ5IG87_9ASTR